MSNNLENPNEHNDVTDESVSYASNVIVTRLESKSLREIFNTIQTGSDGLVPKIEQIRKLPTKPERDKLKQDTLPIFCCGTFRGDQRKNECFEKSHFIILDFDHLSPEKLTEVKSTVRKDPRVYASFLSPSADGLKVMYRLDTDVTGAARYSELYVYYAELISDEYGCRWDKATKDAARACFISYDPDVYVNEKANMLTTSVTVERQPRSSAIIQQNKPSTDPLAELLATGTIAGDRTHSATQIIGHCISRGYGKAVTLELVKMWNQKNDPPHTEQKIITTVDDMYARYKHAEVELPYEIISKNNSYYKLTYSNRKPTERMITTFTIEPKELLQFDDGDCLRTTITSALGYTYQNVTIENTDWHTKSKLLKAIGHQDCTFHGSENDVQALCSFVNQKVPIRKKGTKVVGLLPEESTWVTDGINITSDGISTDPQIISYDKGKSAFYRGIQYEFLDDQEYARFIAALYADIRQINEPEIIVPWLSWIFASPVKPILMDHVGGFPLTFVHGPQGSGKTTTARLMKRLCGYKDAKPHSCKEKTFPMLKLLSSTNAVPVVLDEFKAKLLTEDQMNTVIAFMNKAYSGEIESKGQADQTTKDYEILAPLCVMGEWNISVPSVHERILTIRLKETVKRDRNMQAALDRVLKLPLEAFMPRYIQFCLKQDIPQMFDSAKEIVERHFGSITIAPRIMNNLAVMTLGIELFERFGHANGVAVQPTDTSGILNHQLREITGSEGGFVQSAVDQLINELSVIALKEKPTATSIACSPTRDLNGYDCIIRKEYDYKLSTINDKTSGSSVEVLAINFTKIFPDFKKYAKQTGYEGDLLDKESYSRLFDECAYVYKKDHPVKFNEKSTRSLCIDISKALSAGINLEGFGIAG